MTRKLTLQTLTEWQRRRHTLSSNFASTCHPKPIKMTHICAVGLAVTGIQPTFLSRCFVELLTPQPLKD